MVLTKEQQPAFWDLEKLGGFAQKEQILETYNIDKDLAFKTYSEGN